MHPPPNSINSQSQTISQITMSQIPIDNNYALTLKALHQPGKPLILTNVFDTTSTRAVLRINDLHSPPLVKALATTSFAIASALGIHDEELSLPQTLDAIAEISPLARAAGLPLTVDLQDGYGDQIVVAMKRVIELGAVGANIEDSYPERGFGDGMKCLRSVEEAAARIRLAVETARELGLPNFVVNARTDILRLMPNPEGWTRKLMVGEAVKRGKSYLEAGATCVFVWGGPAGFVTSEELKHLAGQFDGRLNVRLANDKGGLSVKEVTDLGVCRISIGGSLSSKDVEKMQQKAIRILNGGKLWEAEC